MANMVLAVKMHVKVPTVSTEQAKMLAQETHDVVCPYSHATRGNIEFTLVLVGK